MEKQLTKWDLDSVTTLRKAWEEAFGEYGVYSLVGALVAHVDDSTLNRLYQEAVSEIERNGDK